MARRRRNKIVISDWSPHGKHEHTGREATPSSIVRTAVGAAVLLGVLIVLFSSMPVSTSGYRRDHLATFICESVGVEPGTARCGAVAVTGWFLIVLALGLVFKAGRIVLNAVGLRHE